MNTITAIDDMIAYLNLTSDNFEFTEGETHLLLDALEFYRDNQSFSKDQ